MYDMRHGILPSVIIMFGLSERIAPLSKISDCLYSLSSCTFSFKKYVIRIASDFSPSELVLRVIIFSTKLY